MIYVRLMAALQIRSTDLRYVKFNCNPSIGQRLLSQPNGIATIDQGESRNLAGLAPSVCPVCCTCLIGYMKSSSGIPEDSSRLKENFVYYELE
jgi:hypothetical protein